MACQPHGATGRTIQEEMLLKPFNVCKALYHREQRGEKEKIEVVLDFKDFPFHLGETDT